MGSIVIFICIMIILIIIAVEDLRNQGKNVFLEIEVNGATQVLNTVHDEGDGRGVLQYFDGGGSRGDRSDGTGLSKGSARL